MTQALKTLLASLFFLFPSQGQAESLNACEIRLTSEGNAFSSRAIGYLEFLRESGQTQVLDRIEESLNSESPSTAEGLDQSSLLTIRIWQNLLLASGKDRSPIHSWFREYRRNQRETTLIRHRVVEDTLGPGRGMAFHPIKPEFFDPDLPSFSLMDTPVTEAMWLQVMEAPPQIYLSREGSDSFEGGLKPVVSFSKDELGEFLGRLNRMANDPDSSIHQILKGHQHGDVYEIPSELFVSSLAEKLFRAHSDIFETELAGFNTQTSVSSLLHPFAWFKENSDPNTGPSPVGRKMPLEVEGHDFYDLVGNVFEIFRTWNANAPDAPPEYKHWGGSSGTPANSFRARLPHQVPAFLGFLGLTAISDRDGIGFRLVRKRPRPPRNPQRHADLDIRPLLE